MEKLNIIKTEEKRKEPMSAQKQETILTAAGVVFILVLTIGTVYSFEARNARMLHLVENTVIAGARG